MLSNELRPGLTLITTRPLVQWKPDGGCASLSQDGRVAEWLKAPVDDWRAGNSPVGSNPAPSATLFPAFSRPEQLVFVREHLRALLMNNLVTSGSSATSATT